MDGFNQLDTHRERLERGREGEGGGVTNSNIIEPHNEGNQEATSQTGRKKENEKKRKEKRKLKQVKMAKISKRSLYVCVCRLCVCVCVLARHVR